MFFSHPSSCALRLSHTLHKILCLPRLAHKAPFMQASGGIIKQGRKPVLFSNEHSRKFSSLFQSTSAIFLLIYSLPAFMLLTVLHNCTLCVMTFAVSAFAIYDRWINNSKVWSRKTHSTERVLRSIIWCCVFMYRNCWKLNSCIMWWWKMLTNSKTYILISTKKCNF